MAAAGAWDVLDIWAAPAAAADRTPQSACEAHGEAAEYGVGRAGTGVLRRFQIALRRIDPAWSDMAQA